MIPEAATAAQVQIYRRMTGEERLALALHLHELACELAREGIRQQFPEAHDAEIEQRLRDRIRLAYSL